MSAALTRLLVFGLVSIACVSSPRSARAPVDEPPTLEQLYVDQRYGELVLAAANVIDAEGVVREAVAEARLFRALAWSAVDPHRNQPRVLAELRVLELEYPDLVWGRMAAHLVEQLTRADALQATLLELVLERRELRARIETLEQRLAEVQSELDQADSERVAVGRERAELVEQLELARTQVASTAARVRELEDELAALKQIDMQREP